MSAIATGSDLATVIKRSRLVQGLNQTRLGQKVGVKTSTVSGWENGARKPRPDVIPDLAAVLRIDAHLLAGLVMSAAR